MPNINFGYTLIEVILCLILLGILSKLTMPGLNNWNEATKVEVAVEEFERKISFARVSAITLNQVVTFCRSNDGKGCNGNWSDGTIIFTDQNENHQIDVEDELLRYDPKFESNLSIKYRSFQNRQYLQITPMGFTNYQNGNFTFCPPDLNINLAQQLIINTTGRTRRAQDRDGDGIRENSQGKALVCP